MEDYKYKYDYLRRLLEALLLNIDAKIVKKRQHFEEKWKRLLWQRRNKGSRIQLVKFLFSLSVKNGTVHFSVDTLYVLLEICKSKNITVGSESYITEQIFKSIKFRMRCIFFLE